MKIKNKTGFAGKKLSGSNVPPKEFQYKEILKCGKDPLYFIKNYVKISHPVKGLVPFKTFPYQDDCVDEYQKNRFIIVNKSRQLGLSTISAAYSLWMAIFQREKNILVIATKLDVAKLFIKKVDDMLRSLPPWLVMPNVTIHSVKEIGFSNGSRIKATPTSLSAARGEALSLVVVDECAHIEGIDELWLAMWPTLSCVTGDTLILTDNGLIPIEDFHKNRKIGEYFNLDLNVYGKEGIEKTSHGYVSPNHDTLIITTKHGHSVEVTPIHPLYTLQDSGLGHMTKAQDLKIGNNLRIEVGMNVFGKKTMPKDIAYMLGGYTAEGWINKRRSSKDKNKWLCTSVSICNTDENFRNVYTTSRELNKHFTTVPSKKSVIRCCSKELVEQFISYGIDPHQTCYTKTVPSAVLQGTKDVVCSYLSGYFDGDSNVSSRGISAFTTSKKLAQQINIMLHNLGYVSNVTKVHARENQIGRIMPSGQKLKSLSDGWTITIARSQMKKFAEEIGFTIERKQNLVNSFAVQYIQDDRKLKALPVDQLKSSIESVINERKLSKSFYRDNGLRLDKALSLGANGKKVNSNWLQSFKDISSREKALSLEEEKFFNENIGSFYWDEIISIEKSFNKTYDFTVPKTHSFLQNGILGSNTGGSAILISTPAGVGNLFHRIWSGAISKENDFKTIELPWTVHPERDQKWFDGERKQIIAAMGERGVAQELLCAFNGSGDTFLPGNVLDLIESTVKEPIYHHPLNDDIWIWEQPVPGHKYVISADVASGAGKDHTTFHIIDVTSESIAGEFKSNKVSTDDFSKLLLAVGTEYNTAMLCPELNAYGLLVAKAIKDANYSNLYYEKFRNLYSAFMQQDIKPQDLPGIYTGPKNRDEMLAKLETIMRNGQLRIHSKRLLDELKTFIWKGNRAEAMKGYNDDLVMALAVGTHIFNVSGDQQYTAEEFQKAMLVSIARSNVSLTQTPLGGYSTTAQQQTGFVPPVFVGNMFNNTNQIQQNDPFSEMKRLQNMQPQKTQQAQQRPNQAGLTGLGVEWDWLLK